MNLFYFFWVLIAFTQITLFSIYLYKLNEWKKMDKNVDNNSIFYYNRDHLK
jgi:hypothetical protein